MFGLYTDTTKPVSTAHLVQALHNTYIPCLTCRKGCRATSVSTTCLLGFPSETFYECIYPNQPSRVFRAPLSDHKLSSAILGAKEHTFYFSVSRENKALLKFLTPSLSLSPPRHGWLCGTLCLQLRDKSPEWGTCSS